MACNIKCPRCLTVMDEDLDDTNAPGKYKVYSNPTTPGKYIIECLKCGRLAKNTIVNWGWF